MNTIFHFLKKAKKMKKLAPNLSGRKIKICLKIVGTPTGQGLTVKR